MKGIQYGLGTNNLLRVVGNDFHSLLDRNSLYFGEFNPNSIGFIIFLGEIVLRVF